MKRIAFTDSTGKRLRTITVKTDDGITFKTETVRGEPRLVIRNYFTNKIVQTARIPAGATRADAVREERQ